MLEFSERAAGDTPSDLTIRLDSCLDLADERRTLREKNQEMPIPAQSLVGEFFQRLQFDAGDFIE